MESEVRVASQRKQFAKRIRQWLGDAADDEADSEHQDEGGIVFRMRRRHSDDDDNDDDEYDDNGKLKPPKLETELQRTQVRALLCMTRLNDHFDHNCSDDYRGTCVTWFLSFSLSCQERDLTYGLQDASIRRTRGA
jgi:hypothetical protein